MPTQNSDVASSKIRLSLTMCSTCLLSVIGALNIACDCMTQLRCMTFLWIASKSHLVRTCIAFTAADWGVA